MRCRVVLALALCCLASPASAASATNWDVVRKSLVVRKYVSKTSKVSGNMAVSARVEHNGSATPVVANAGIKDKASGEAVGPEDSFAIGSTTKMFTAVAVMQLAERGLLSLNASVTDYISQAVVDNLTSGNAQGLQIRHLLGHCSGMGDYLNWSPNFNDTDVLKFYGVSGAKNYTPQDILQLTDQLSKPAHILGRQGFDSYDHCPVAYSNTGYIMLGVAIEQASGLSWEEYVKRNIFGPANMTESSFLTQKRASVTGYATGVWPGPVAMPPSLAWSAGEILSTPRDLASFMWSAMRGDFFDGAGTLRLWLDAPYHAFDLGTYGYGLMKIPLPGGRKLIGHAGQTFGQQSALFYDTAADMVYVWLENDSQLGSPVLSVMQMAAGLLD